MLFAVLLAGAAGPAADIATLELHYGNESPLSEGQHAALQSTALRLVESSNFNSQRHSNILRTTPREIHAAYRKALAGRYLVVSYKTPRRISTVGSDIVVSEIVIGLNGRQFADALFTIDERGAVVSHGKYSGGLCIELLNEVRKARPDA